MQNTIYRGIHAGLFDGCIGGRRAARRLRRKGRRRRAAGREERRGKIVVSHTIDERPAAAEERSRLGDWEADTVAGKAGGACLATFTDRRSGFLVCFATLIFRFSRLIFFGFHVSRQGRTANFPNLRTCPS